VRNSENDWKWNRFGGKIDGVVVGFEGVIVGGKPR
jgi:hypothetical protein